MQIAVADFSARGRQDGRVTRRRHLTSVARSDAFHGIERFDTPNVGWLFSRDQTLSASIQRSAETG